MHAPKAHISFFAPSLRGGGAERVLLNLAQDFCRQGINVDLVLSSAVGEYLPLLPPQVRLIDLGASRVLTSLPGLVRYLRKERPGVMLSTLDHANMVALCANAISGGSTRLVIRVANTISIKFDNSREKRSRLIPFLARKLYFKADGIVAVSKGVANDLVENIKIPSSLIRVIHNPVVTEELVRGAQKPLDHPWFSSGAIPVILGVGRLEKQKDFKTLIKSFVLARKEIPSRLVILGEGSERTELEGLAEKMGVSEFVSLPGFADNPFTYMAQSSVFVLSSAWEGLPNVLIQAMAVGTPVISTDCKSGPCEILDGGKLGPLVPVSDHKLLAKAIIDKLRNPTDRKILQAKADQFSLKNISREYFNYLTGI